METNTIEAEAPPATEKIVRKEKPPIIPTPIADASAKKPIRLRLHVGKNFIRQLEFYQTDSRKKPTQVIHLYPTLADWIGRSLPDGVNPRSHDPECLRSPVARQIEQMILNAPDDFVLANRGATVIADSFAFDPKTGDAEITITDPENQGLADGATTDAVIAKVQTQLAREFTEKKDATFLDLMQNIKKQEDIPAVLRHSRVHVEVFVNLEDRSRMANLVQGRNTSRQVRGWSMSDFKGEFEWIKAILEKKGSEFEGKIGYEENAGKDITILDVLSILTLFHPEFDEREDGAEKAPVIAYSNKGRMDARLSDDKLRKGYKSLSPLVPDILKLHDYVYAGFEQAYDKAHGPKAKLGRREGVESRLLGQPYELPLTGLKSNYVLPNGFIFPLLAAFRALIVVQNGDTKWKIQPYEFFDKYGKKLVAELMDQVEGVGGNPNKAGKNKLVYTALHKQARLFLADEIEEKRSSKK